MKQTYRSWAKKRRPKLRDNIWRLLAPSVLSMIVCMICLVGLTMAWFSSSVETATDPISTTWFEGAEPKVTDVKTRTTPEIENDYYKLKSGTTYSIILAGKDDGMPENSSLGCGYANVYMKISSQSQDVEQKDVLVGTTAALEPDQYGTSYLSGITFFVNAKSDCLLKIEYQWGSPTTSTIENNKEYESDKFPLHAAVISFPDPYTAAMLNAQELLNEQTTGEDEANAEKDKAKTYTVKKGDTLESIAKANGITVKQLAEYNKLEVTDKIKVGQELKIPPKDSEKPTKPDKETTEKQTEESPTQSDKKAPSEETTAKATTTNQTTTVDSEKPDTTTKAKEDKPEPITEKSPVTTTEVPSEAEEETEEPAADPSVEDSTEVSETTTQPESEAEQVGQALKDQSPADE